MLKTATVHALLQWRRLSPTAVRDGCLGHKFSSLPSFLPFFLPPHFSSFVTRAVCLASTAKACSATSSALTSAFEVVGADTAPRDDAVCAVGEFVGTFTFLTLAYGGIQVRSSVVMPSKLR